MESNYREQNAIVFNKDFEQHIVSLFLGWNFKPTKTFTPT